MEMRWDEGRNHAIPVVIIALGGVLILGAVSAPFKQKPRFELDTNGMTGTFD